METFNNSRCDHSACAAIILLVLRFKQTQPLYHFSPHALKRCNRFEFNFIARFLIASNCTYARLTCPFPHRTRSLYCCCCCCIAVAALLLLLHCCCSAASAAARAIGSAAFVTAVLHAPEPSHRVSLERRKCRKVLRSLRYDERSIAALCSVQKKELSDKSCTARAPRLAVHGVTAANLSDVKQRRSR